LHPSELWFDKQTYESPLDYLDHLLRSRGAFHFRNDPRACAAGWPDEAGFTRDTSYSHAGQ
jgi:hypothetical protein